jgi:hypothetical protein
VGCAGGAATGETAAVGACARHVKIVANNAATRPARRIRDISPRAVARTDHLKLT